MPAGARRGADPGRAARAGAAPYRLCTSLQQPASAGTNGWLSIFPPAWRARPRTAFTLVSMPR